MTELLYQTDAYLKEFSALIKAVDAEARALVLDRSAFYPGGAANLVILGLWKPPAWSIQLKKRRNRG